MAGVTGKIADGVIKIALAGYEAVKGQLTALQAQTKKLGDSLLTIGSASSRGFAVATGGIAGFLKAADPVRFTVFTQKLEILGIYIGLTFIPLLQSAIDWLDRLIGFFKGLTDEQREQILHWTKVGLAVLAAGTALGTVALVLPKIIGLIKALAVAVSILTSSTGVGLVLALAAAAFGVFQLLKATGKLDPLLASLEKAFGGFTEAVASVFGKLAAVVAPLLETVVGVASDLFSRLVEAVVPVVEQVVATVGEMLSQLLPVVVPFLKALGKLLASLIPPLVQIGAAVLKLYVLWYGTLFKLFLALVQAVLPALVRIIQAVTRVVEALTPVVTELVEVFAEVATLVADLAGEVLTVLADILAEIVGILADLFVAFWDAFGDDIIATIRLVADVIKEVLGYVKELIVGLKEAVSTAKEAYSSIRGTVGDVADDVSRLWNDPLGVAGEVLDFLNPFASREEPRPINPDDHPPGPGHPTGAGDYSGERGAGGGFDDGYQGGDYGGDFGGDTPPKKTGFWERMFPQLFGGKKAEEVKPGRQFAPMAGMGKVEMFGVEEAFRKAQTGATFDPAKMAELERKKLQMESRDFLREIATNTAKQPGAYSAF